MGQAEDDAYRAAEAEIARAKVEGWERLDFDKGQFRALDRIPSQIGGLSEVRKLTLDRTRIFDLTPLTGLIALNELRLCDTPVLDLVPLSGLTALTTLLLEVTKVSDLMPLASLTNLKTLGLGATWVSDLTPLAGLIALTGLRLDGTQVSDLTPLADLTTLRNLKLLGTQVTDLTPLAGLNELTTLVIQDTPAVDLRPLRRLRGLIDRPDFYGLRFNNCGAARADARIAEIAEIEDPSERARTLFDYLEDWQPPREAVDGGGADPLADVRAEDGRLEVAASTPSEAEAEERLKKVLHERLKDKAAALAQAAGNRFFRLAARARAVCAQVEKPFDELDLLMLHLAVDDLRDLEALGREEDDGEAFPPEVQVPLGDVLRLGPGLTLGHAEVDLLVERANARRAAPAVPEAELAAQDAMSAAVAGDADAIGDRLRALEDAVQGKDSAEPREMQKAVHRSVLWKIGAWSLATAGTVATGVFINGISGPVVAWVQANYPILQAAAATYGPAFSYWFASALASFAEFAPLVAAWREQRR